MPGETRQARLLEAAAGRLERVHERTRRRVAGERRGARVEVSLLWGPAWRVRAPLPPLAAALDIFSRAHALGSRATFALGDPGFDRSYGVDGAPEGLVVALLDAEMRRRIAALGPDRIRTRDGAVEILKRYQFHFDERREIAEALDLAGDLVRRVEAVAREAERALVRRAPQAGEPYRGGPDVRAVEELTRVRDDEVRAAAKRTRRRWNKSRAAAGILFGGWTIFEVVVQIL